VLENVRISGCNGSAVRITVDATGAYTAPAVLRNVHIIGNSGSRGVAVSLGAYAAIVVESSTITGNTATESVVYAEAGSTLGLFNTTVSGNNGTGIAFEGSSLTVLDSVLLDNTGINGSAISIACPSVGGDIDGCNSQTRINDTRFEGNRATGVGGAVYMRDSTFAALHNVTFVRNSAREGGALAADRDACLFNMTLVIFENNRANDR
jgi:predicted outer membrane repeat protein